MAYCTQTDLLAQISEATLIQLTDDDNAGAVVDSVVTSAIAGADAEIDSYCSTRYASPLTPVPPIVAELSVNIAIYKLYARRKGAPEDRRKRYDDAIRLLKDISKGLVNLGVEAPPPASSQYAGDSTSSTRIFTREKMGGF